MPIETCARKAAAGQSALDAHPPGAGRRFYLLGEHLGPPRDQVRNRVARIANLLRLSHVWARRVGAEPLDQLGLGVPFFHTPHCRSLLSRRRA